MKKYNTPKKHTALRVIKTVFSFYPVMMPVTLICIIINAIVSSIQAVFMQNVIAMVEQSWQSGDWSAVGSQILMLVAVLISIYVFSLISGFAYGDNNSGLA